MSRLILLLVFTVLIVASTAQASRNGISKSHLLGWNCIHNGEAQVAGWHANTGNGYYGGLQAHYNWYGVARMDYLTPMRQILHAEIAASQNHFSYSWMRGQWPNTYPPCARYFD